MYTQCFISSPFPTLCSCTAFYHLLVYVGVNSLVCVCTAYKVFSLFFNLLTPAIVCAMCWLLHNCTVVAFGHSLNCLLYKSFPEGDGSENGQLRHMLLTQQNELDMTEERIQKLQRDIKLYVIHNRY